MLKFRKNLKISQAIQDSFDKCSNPTVIESFSRYIIKDQEIEEDLEDGIPYYALKQLLVINPDLNLFEILKGSKIVLDKPLERKKSPKLLEILKECQDIIDKKEYKRMTKGLVRDVDSRFSDVRFTIGQLSSILNVIFSMAAVFTVVMYFGDQVAMGNLSLKVLLALFCSWVVGIAEGYFLFRDLLEIQDQEEKLESFGKKD